MNVRAAFVDLGDIAAFIDVRGINTLLRNKDGTKAMMPLTFEEKIMNPVGKQLYYIEADTVVSAVTQDLWLKLTLSRILTREVAQSEHI